ncbi:MAG TPA: 50S ribosomal protein L17 [Chitinivibrionales bacterium]|nr:50S ribosomal protein L17 [Chitinivibrionales bacterium]
MRHLSSVSKLGMRTSHRNATLGNLAMSVLDMERVITTVPKAKVARSLVEHLITIAKRGGLHAVRLAAQTITQKDVLQKLFTDIAPSYKTREGGYTRILKLGERWGDNAQTCVFELVGRNSLELSQLRKKKRKAPGAEPAAGEAGKDKEAPEEKAVEKKEEKAAPKEKEAKKEKKEKAAPKKKKAPEKKTDDSADKKKKSK